MDAILNSPNLRQKMTPQTVVDIESDQATLRQMPKLPMKKILVVSLSLLLVGTSFLMGWQWYQHLSTHEETDDAYVTSHLHQVSTRVNGTVENVLVDDNDHVKAGQVLVTIDPRDLQVKVDQCVADLKQAEQQAQVANTTVSYANTNAQGQEINARGSVSNASAAISKAEASVRETQSDIKSKQADLAARDAEVVRSQADYDRYVALEKQGAVTTSQRDAARRDYLVATENRKSAADAVVQAEARLDQARESVNTARAQLIQSQGQTQLARASVVQTHVNKDQYSAAMAAVERARTALAEAQLNLSYTKIIAPTSGRVGKKTVEEGQRIEPGQPLLTIVADNPWVVANFKETQLKKMHAGEKVELTIDSFPDHKFTGHVLSFSPASGASFAVLPSDNATGNFTKIVQRLPVKITFDAQSLKGYEDKLAPGMSAVATVDLQEQQTNVSESNERLSNNSTK